MSLVIPSLLVAGALLAAKPTSLPREKDAWIELSTAHFTLLSNGREAEARRIGIRLERLRQALSALTPDATLNAPRPTTIYVFDSESSFRPYRPLTPEGKPWEVVGLFVPSAVGNYVAIAEAPRTDPYRSIYHEYLHEVVDSNLGTVPLWFTEGLAEYYSSFWLDGNAAELGRTIVEHELWLRQYSWLPLADLLAVGPESKDYNEGTRQGSFYAQSWLLVHYFEANGPERQRALGDFLNRLAAGTPVAEAAKGALGMSVEELDRALHAYAKASRLPLWRITFTDLAVDQTATLRQLPYEEVLFRLGDFLAHTDGQRRAADVEAFLSASAARNHAYALPVAARGEVALAAGDLATAVALLRRAVALDPRCERAQHLLGRATLGQAGAAAASSPSEASARLAESRAALQAAIALAPERAESHAQLGIGYVLSSSLAPSEDVGPGIEALRLAWQRMPSRLELGSNLAVLLVRAGRRADAIAIIEQRLAQAADPSLAAHARRGLLEADVRAANDLMRAGKQNEAEAAMEAAIAATSEAGLRADLSATLASWRDTAARNAHIAAYNRAVEQANGRQLATARDTLQALVAELDPAREADLDRAARDLLSQVEAFLARK